MLATIKTYLTLGVITLTLMLAGYSYKLHGDVQRLEQSLAMYVAAVEANEKALEQSKASCLISIETLAEHYRKENELSTSQQAAGDAINALPTLTIKEKAHAAPVSIQSVPTKPQGFSDDDRLSPDLMRLLDKAYCDGDKDGCAAPAE